MNIFERAGITVVKPRNYQELYTVRQEHIKKEGSEFFSWNVPATNASATSSIEVSQEFPRSKKYAPLDWIQVVNNELANDLALIINSNEQIPVPHGTIITVDNKALREVGILNNGAVATTLNNIRVTLQRQPETIDKWARRQA